MVNFNTTCDNDPIYPGEIYMYFHEVARGVCLYSSSIFPPKLTQPDPPPPPPKGQN